MLKNLIKKVKAFMTEENGDFSVAGIAAMVGIIVIIGVVVMIFTNGMADTMVDWLWQQAQSLITSIMGEMN